MKSSKILNSSRTVLAFLLLYFFNAATECVASLSLTIQSHGPGSLIVTWPNPGNYVLETNFNLGTTNWARDNALTVNSNGMSIITIDPAATAEFFRVERTIPMVSPTNLTGMTEFWNYNDLPTDPMNNVSIDSWTDEINNVALTAYQNEPIMMATLPDMDTNGDGTYYSSWEGGYTYPYYAVAPGLTFLSYDPYLAQVTPTALTNASGALTVANSNFTFWIVFRSFFPTNDNTWWIWSDGQGDGICIQSNVISSVWNGTTNYSSLALTDPSCDAFGVGYGYGINYDIIDAGGTLYSNGVQMQTGIGQPTNGFAFTSLGGCSNTLMGAIQYIGIWTNYTFSSVDASNLDAWYWNFNCPGCGVTNITNGLIAWWRLNDASGTTAADSAGTNTMIFGGTGTVWTNVGPLYGESLCFDGNGWATNVNTLFTDGDSNMTVTAWLNMTTNSYSIVSDDAISGIGSISKCTAYGSGWYIWANDPGLVGNSTPYSGWGAGDADGEENVGQYIETCCSWYSLDTPTFPAVGDGNWHFISMVMSNNLLAFYVDGAQYVDNAAVDQDYITHCPAPTTLSCPTIPIALGGGLNTTNLMDQTDWVGVPGTMEDVRIYARDLSQQEINDLFKWRGQ
jgi:hypothetical protein